MVARCVALTALALAIPTGCGGGADGGRAAAPQRTVSPERTAAPTPAVSADDEVLRGWSDALRRSDVAAASAFFAVPSLVAQGAPRVLRSRADVAAFNDSLPCGARLRSVRRVRGYVVGSFDLVERPGERCDAPGSRAAVAARIRDGRIVEWRQLPGDPSEPDVPAGPRQEV